MNARMETLRAEALKADREGNTKRLIKITGIRARRNRKLLWQGRKLGS